jgi:hypothetical protein
MNMAATGVVITIATGLIAFLVSVGTSARAGDVDFAGIGRSAGSVTRLRSWVVVFTCGTGRSEEWSEDGFSRLECEKAADWTDCSSIRLTQPSYSGASLGPRPAGPPAAVQNDSAVLVRFAMPKIAEAEGAAPNQIHLDWRSSEG